MYWLRCIYNKVERGLAWLAVIIGFTILIIYGSIEAIGQFFDDSQAPGIIKFAVSVLVVGGLILLFSVIREKFFTQTRDKYNRLLGYLFLEDGLFFNKWMIENGYAYEYTYNDSYKYQEEFKNAENYARDNQLGLWNPDTCDGSTEFQSDTSEPEPEPEPEPQTQFSCSVSKNCGDMVSCDEAYFYLNTCL